MTSGIIEILIESSLVQAVLSQDARNQWKVYPVIAPEGVQAPYIIVAEETLNPTISKGCPSTLDFPRYNVMAYSLDFRQTELMQEACRITLDNGQGFTTDAGADFDGIQMVDRKDLFMPAQGQGAGLFVKLGVYSTAVTRTVT